MNWCEEAVKFLAPGAEAEQDRGAARSDLHPADHAAGCEPDEAGDLQSRPQRHAGDGRRRTSQRSPAPSPISKCGSPSPTPARAFRNEHLSNLFQPFFTTRKTGTGLGLLIVRRIIREHGGEIELESREGEGTKVNIYLPLVEKKMRYLEAPAELKVVDSPVEAKLVEAAPVKVEQATLDF